VKQRVMVELVKLEISPNPKYEGHVRAILWMQ